jgi:quercetin dioxygenase-like cupin family protein
MKPILMVAAALVGGSILALSAAQAQQSVVTRTDLQRHDLGIPGREVVQARVDVAQGGTAPAHTHPGEEIIYVLSGVFEYRIGNDPPKTLHAGDALFVPARTVHSAKNVGTGVASELATYVVEKGKPLVTPAP